MAEHQLRYAEFAQFRQSGICRRHQRSSRQRQCVNANELGYFNKHKGWQKCVNDLYELMVRSNRISDIPVILFSHNMGSIMARNFVQRYDARLTD
ncbi:MAG: hypothetical protein ACLSA6_18900 [Holdemania massiliensis]